MKIAQEHYLIVTMERGFSVFDIQGYMESTEKKPNTLYSQSDKAWYALDVYEQEETAYALLGNWDGQIWRLNLKDL